MNQIERAAFITSQTACALIEMEGMRAENEFCKQVKINQRYMETDFQGIPAKYGIDHNSVIGYLRQMV